MKRQPTFVFVGSILLIGIACTQTPPASSPASSTPTQGAVERGQYLVTAMACNDCHTPFKLGPNGPEPDMTRMLSGHPETVKLPPPPPITADSEWNFIVSSTNTAYAGMWGVSYAANLTPDENTGIGIWTEDMFVRAMRQGKHMGTSRTILPPMPWNWIGKLSDEDLKAVYAYLKSLPAVTNHVPDPTPPPGAPAGGGQ